MKFCIHCGTKLLDGASCTCQEVVNVATKEEPTKKSPVVVAVAIGLVIGLGGFGAMTLLTNGDDSQVTQTVTIEAPATQDITLTSTYYIEEEIEEETSPTRNWPTYFVNHLQTHQSELESHDNFLEHIDVFAYDDFAVLVIGNGHVPGLTYINGVVTENYYGVNSFGQNRLTFQPSNRSFMTHPFFNGGPEFFSRDFYQIEGDEFVLQFGAGGDWFANDNAPYNHIIFYSERGTWQDNHPITHEEFIANRQPWEATQSYTPLIFNSVADAISGIQSMDENTTFPQTALNLDFLDWRYNHMRALQANPVAGIVGMWHGNYRNHQGRNHGLQIIVYPTNYGGFEAAVFYFEGADSGGATRFASYVTDIRFNEARGIFELRDTRGIDVPAGWGTNWTMELTPMWDGMLEGGFFNSTTDFISLWRNHSFNTLRPEALAFLNNIQIDISALNLH